MARRRSGSTTRRDAASQEVRGNRAKERGSAWVDPAKPGKQEEDEWRITCSSAGDGRQRDRHAVKQPPDVPVHGR